ncbi:conserved protein of unknown function [Ectopseudomonas oleovorans]|uniref:Uncharacterized protein n=1 Tax=Ectopseudomonas oleovorans TaxID=301 RepID=A0A653B1Q7_ECTOL|nr:conserved protein of unknown function [Pseudomonas oleovorans]
MVQLPYKLEMPYKLPPEIFGNACIITGITRANNQPKVYPPCRSTSRASAAPPSTMSPSAP